MRSTARCAYSLVAALCLQFGSAAAQVPASSDLATARARARAENKLLLLELGATWCAPCKAFARDLHALPELQLALAAVVLAPVDAERGEGPALVTKYSVTGLPTFVLVTPAGEVVDRTVGYTFAAPFTSWLASARADPQTVAEKEAQLARAPTADLAARLAALRVAESNLRAGVELYRQARALAAPAASRYQREIFATMETGWAAGKPGFGADSLQAAADVVLAATPPDAALLLHVASTMRALAARRREPQRAAPYLAAAVAASAGVSDAALLEQRRALLPDHALYVEHDAEKAARLQRDLQPVGWREDRAKVNAYAWWCLDHGVDLEEAETLARHAIEIAAPGRDKAMLLDTLAEIRARRGDPADAARIAAQAAREVPDNPYYPKQAERFRQAAAGVRARP